MTFEGHIGKAVYEEIMQHVGHKIVAVYYGSVLRPDNAAIECETCSAVIIDAERQTPF